MRGFSKIERQLLEGTVRLSQRRNPRLELVAEDKADTADVVMIDALDAQAVRWGEQQFWLADKAVIWVDSRSPRAGHTLVKRPVQWPILPMLLARALEQSAAVHPVAAAAAAHGLRSSSDSAVKRVLVIDDSLAVRNHLRSLLEACGLQVSEADCVAAALKALAAERFDCALMDVLMPEVDGYEGCKRIKGLKASVGQLPVVMLTSKSSPFDRIRGKMAGCDAYLTKPVEPAQLYDVLAQHIGVVVTPVADGRSVQSSEPAANSRRLVLEQRA